MNIALHLIVCTFMIKDNYQLVCVLKKNRPNRYMDVSKAFRQGSIILVGIQMLTVTKTNHGKQRVSRASISRDVFAAIQVTCPHPPTVYSLQSLSFEPLQAPT